MRGHLVPVGAGLLPAGRFRRESRPVHIHPTLADHVLPTHLRNHSVDVTGRAPPGQVSIIYYVSSWPLRPHNHRRTQHALPKAQHAQGNLSSIQSIQL